MVIQTESRPGFGGGYQVQAAAHMAVHDGYGHGGGGTGTHIPPIATPYMNVLKPGCGSGYEGINKPHLGFNSTTTDHYSSRHHHHGPSGNVQTYSNYESSKYSGGGQPNLHLHGYGHVPLMGGGHGHGHKLESGSYEYSSSARPPISMFPHTSHQEGWTFKSIDD